MNMWVPPLVHLAMAVLGVYATWLVQCRTRNGGIIDVSWTFIVGAAGIVYALLGTGDWTMRAVAGLLSAAWALRLGGYLAIRNIGKPEDRRYAELRERWGERADNNMLRFYLFQALIAWIIGLSFLPLAYQSQIPAPGWLLTGTIIGALGIMGEGLADWQLARFRHNPANKGRVCNTGLWRYSRHPNYFFECLHWLAYPILAIGAPMYLLSLIGAVVIPVLLLKISGIPTVESSSASRQRQGYAEYVRQTSAFIPLPPRKG